MIPVPKIFGGLGLHFGRISSFTTPEWHRRLVYNMIHGDCYQSWLAKTALASISVEKNFERGVSLSKVDNSHVGNLLSHLVKSRVGYYKYGADDSYGIGIPLKLKRKYRGLPLVVRMSVAHHELGEDRPWYDWKDGVWYPRT